MRIAVVALGKIGLPLAVQYADKGHEVIGVDVNPAVVEAVNAGTEPFPGEAHLAEKLAALSPATGNGALRATTDYAEAIPEADAINAFAGSSCNGRGAGIAWFKGAELHYYLTDRGAQWHRECDNASDEQHAEALNYIVGRPTVYLDGNGTMYLKRSADGKVSQWREVRG